MRKAIFLAPDGLGCLVVGEGGQVGAVEVAAIQPDKAELTGPAGSYTMEPTPQAYREAVTESDQ